MSSLSGPLQVVPDIDDQVANPENPQEVRMPRQGEEGSGIGVGSGK